MARMFAGPACRTYSIAFSRPPKLIFSRGLESGQIKVGDGRRSSRFLLRKREIADLHRRALFDIHFYSLQWVFEIHIRIPESYFGRRSHVWLNENVAATRLYLHFPVIVVVAQSQSPCSRVRAVFIFAACIFPILGHGQTWTRVLHCTIRNAVLTWN